MREITKTTGKELTQQIADKIEERSLSVSADILATKKNVYELLSNYLKAFEDAGNGNIVKQAIHSPDVLAKVARLSDLITELTSKIRLLSNIKNRSQMKMENGTIPFNDQNVDVAGMQINAYYKFLGGSNDRKSLEPVTKGQNGNEENVLKIPDDRTIGSMQHIVDNPMFIKHLRDASRITDLLKASIIAFLNTTESGLEASVEKALKNTVKLNDILNDLINLKKKQELANGKITLTLQSNWLELVYGIEKILVDLKIEIIMFYGGDVKAILNQMDIKVMQRELKRLKEEKSSKAEELQNLESPIHSVKRLFGLMPKKADHQTSIKANIDDIEQRIKVLDTLVKAHNQVK